ncbi:ABC transporter permease subunit [Rothia nasimurium]|uniref:ABC transporter permease subunit n=1 Tax=Rothia nasimurium TaxID=85336 RepID=A0A4Y9F1I2_9MICC|nr:ABC transporter permease subunit [Rothia nasimurium]TFU20123.1 ABC transporter permease subunit [Rothia nasimurium]
MLPTLLTLALIAGPLLALLVRTPWGSLPQLLTEPSALGAVRLSVLTALTTTLISALLGTPTALVLATVLEKSRARRLTWPLYGLIYTPIIFSPVVSGLALLFFWGRRGLLGSWLDTAGISVAYTPLAVVLTQTFVALPFFVATLVTTLRALPPEYAEIARLEGASPAEVTTRVLLPLATPGLLTAAVLTFARALGEYGATVTFAGNIEGVTRTIPLAIELALSSNRMEAALGAALMLVALYLSLLAAGALALWLGRLKGGRPS